MNQLQVFNMNGQLVTESREVAHLIGKEHKELLRTIRQYSTILTSANLRSLDFFIPHEYLDGKKEVRPCYLLTRKGCDMVANKMTGEKGILFTAEYVTKFEEMEQELLKPRPLSEKEQLIASMKLSLENSEELEEVKKEVLQLKEKVETQLTLDYGEQRAVQKRIASRVYELEQDSSIRPLLFRELHREIKDRFAVGSYKDVKKQDLQTALRYIESWIPKKVTAS
ncbi:Rha family transcriptional regulator [Lysinibacillus halotolerans]